MGAPIVTNAGALRFLRYGREYDNRAVVANCKAAVREEGVYENCSVRCQRPRADAGDQPYVSARALPQKTRYMNTV